MSQPVGNPIECNILKLFMYLFMFVCFTVLVHVCGEYMHFMAHVWRSEVN